MLRILGSPKNLCSGMTRRDWLRIGGLGLAGLSLPEILNLQSAAAAESKEREPGFGRAKAIILIHLYGSPSQLEWVDPKPDAPIEIRGQFGVIPSTIPGCKVEVLVPDFQGSHDAMSIVMNAHPDVLNHNTETVPRLYRQVRLGARYERSLEMLRYAKQLRPHIPTKSGLMLGLGETQSEVLQVMRDLRAHHVDILTLGQYLRPSQKHLPIMRYVPQAEFDELKQAGNEMGFAHVEAGPLVRSSYHADASEESATAAACA